MGVAPKPSDRGADAVSRPSTSNAHRKTRVYTPLTLPGVTVVRGNTKRHGYHRHQPTDMNTGFLSLPKSIQYV
jgi:hypothetical protein